MDRGEGLNWRKSGEAKKEIKGRTPESPDKNRNERKTPGGFLDNLRRARTTTNILGVELEHARKEIKELKVDKTKLHNKIEELMREKDELVYEIEARVHSLKRKNKKLMEQIDLLEEEKKNRGVVDFGKASGIVKNVATAGYAVEEMYVEEEEKYAAAPQNYPANKSAKARHKTENVEKEIEFNNSRKLNASKYAAAPQNYPANKSAKARHRTEDMDMAPQNYPANSSATMSVAPVPQNYPANKSVQVQVSDKAPQNYPANSSVQVSVAPGNEKSYLSVLMGTAV